MSNFFHNLGIGIVSTFVAFTGLFNHTPVDISQTPNPQVTVATTSGAEFTSTAVTSIFKKTTQDVVEKPNLNNPSVVASENKTSQSVLVGKQNETAPNNPLVVQSSVVLPAQQPPVVQKNVDKGIPYQGGDGNWYYPKAYDANGRNLLAPFALISNSDTPKLNLATTTDGQYFIVPIQTFQVMGKVSDSTLRKLSVHFTTTGDVKITKVFLYREGDREPLTSSTVDNNGLAIFTIPDGEKDNKFGADIPTQFTIKANFTNVMTTPMNCPSENPSGMRAYQEYYKTDVVSPFSIKSVIKSLDIGLYNDSNNAVKVISDKLENTIQNPTGSCTKYNPNSA